MIELFGFDYLGRAIASTRHRNGRGFLQYDAHDSSLNGTPIMSQTYNVLGAAILAWSLTQSLNTGIYGQCCNEGGGSIKK